MIQPNPIIVEMTVESNDVVMPMTVATQYDLPIDLQTLEADHNGDYSAPAGTAWDNAHVAVPGIEVEPLSATENGTYTPEQNKAFGTVTVNVPVPGIYYTDYGHCYTEHMIIPLVNLTTFGSQYRGASNLKTVKVYPVSGVISSSTMGSQPFMDCASLESAIITAWANIAVQTFRNCPSLKNVQFGDIGYPIESIREECFYGSNNDGLIITIYVDDNTAIPLSRSPWSAPNATIIYRSSTTGEVRTA